MFLTAKNEIGGNPSVNKNIDEDDHGVIAVTLNLDDEHIVSVQILYRYRICILKIFREKALKISIQTCICLRLNCSPPRDHQIILYSYYTALA